MSTIQLILLSALQGITEFLPISSSGHLILFAQFSPFPDQGIALDIAVHLGSILAVLIYFSETIWSIFIGLIKTKFIPTFKETNAKTFWLLLIASLPISFVGFWMLQNGTQWLRDTRIIGWNILIYGIILYIADSWSLTIRSIKHLTVFDAFLIGCAQCLSLIPGTSRSGITITMARFLSMERREAAKFCILLSVPAILGASFITSYLLYNQNDLFSILYAIDGITYSFIFSIIAIYIVMWWLKKSTFLPFVIYRICLGSYLLLDSYGYLNKFLD